MHGHRSGKRGYVEFGAHISATFISANTTRRRQSQRLFNSAQSNTALTHFRRPSFQRTKHGAANHSAYSTRRNQIQRLHISATFISANTTLRFQRQGLLKLSNYSRDKTTNNGYDVNL